MPGPKPFISSTLYDHVQIRSRGYMPHWELTGATYFVTFRLHDSLPKHVIHRLLIARNSMTRAITNDLRAPTVIEQQQIRREFAQSLDRELDQSTGACWFRRPQLAEIAAKALQHFNEDRYELFAWCVMPNHVHVLLDLFDEWRLPSVVHSWKSFIAHRVNKALRREGPVWAREYFDRIIRDDEDFNTVAEYIRANPVKAGLENWSWVG